MVYVHQPAGGSVGNVSADHHRSLVVAMPRLGRGAREREVLEQDILAQFCSRYNYETTSGYVISIDDQWTVNSAVSLAKLDLIDSENLKCN
jgi:hypothetical protein